ncbi:outer membrane receptor protein involved in Fe transport [Sphingopyxis sp. OAS728]|uniref:TonB-dependent receptor n=1 Tax=Sphingopyxis sp. OAS728 TaxID=2663823 RepID=UPI001A105609|nr:TonB-dependent receptor [Sphingopyxis sp. OAS728]MBE1527962.1 outer membrane receptor protein involved in Fe transport [Sphingopyxis sp. OAS728]
MSHITIRLLTVAALALPGVAAAQETAAPEAVLDEIVVTAQKQEQSPIEVPIALTAYDSRALERLGIQGLDQLAQFTPGFEVQQQSPNNPGFIMRGVSSSVLETAFEPRVSVFQDGVSISKGEGSYVELFDIERVEVAKGPQSTLFGRGALVGAVSIIQNKADPDRFDARASAEVGDFSLLRLEGMVNVPLGGGVALRLAGVTRDRDGYVKNALGGEDFQSVDTKALRASLGWRTNGGASLDLIANWQRDRPSGTAFKSILFDQTDPATGAVVSDRRAHDAAALVPGAGFIDDRYGVDREVWGVTLLGSAPLGDKFTISTIGAYREFDSTEINDPDGLSLSLLTAANQGKAEQWSQEVRVNFDDGNRFRGFFGASAFRFDGTHRTPIQIDERILLATLTRQLNGGAAGSGLPATTPAPVSLLTNPAFNAALLQGLVASASDNPATAAVDPQILLSPAQALALAGNLRPNHRETPVDSARLSSYDLFADGTFQVSDALEISAGLRYTFDRRRSSYSAFLTGGRSVLGGTIGAARLASSGSPQAIAQAQAVLAALRSPAVQSIPASALPLFGAIFQPTAGNGGVSSGKIDDSGLTWRLAARYALDEDTSLYTTYARGRRPETLSVTGPTVPFGAPQFVNLDAETVDSVEVGIKFRRPASRFAGNAAVYYYSYDNFETVERDGLRLVPTNGGSAESYGVELQGEWTPFAALSLYGTYAYNHSRFTSGAFDGNRFRQSPDHSASIGAVLRVGSEIEVRPTFTWQSKTFFEDDNDRSDLQQPPVAFVPDTVVDEVQKAFGLVNLTLSYSPDSIPLTFDLFATNLTDRKYFIDAGNSGDRLGLPTFVAGAPRMIGARLTWRLR